MLRERLREAVSQAADEGGAASGRIRAGGVCETEQMKGRRAPVPHYGRKQSKATRWLE